MNTISNQNDIYEQLTSTKAQLANVRETLTHKDEMIPWEVFEYETLEQIHLAKIAELNGFVAELEDKRYITKEQHGTQSAYVYRIIAQNGNGTVTAIPTMTRKTLVAVTGLRRAELTINIHMNELIEYTA